MTENHSFPITPPPELVRQWLSEEYERGLAADHVAIQAAQWGSDQELEACCEWLQDPDLNVDTYKLRAARRPKPPSLKEQALLAIDTAVADYRIAADVADIVRRALE
jgi:hypothetical protein